MMEAPQQQQRSSEGTYGEHVGLNGTNIHTQGTPKSSSSPAPSTYSCCANSWCSGNVSHSNGGNSSTTDESAMSSSWADQIQEGHNTLRPAKLQTLASTSDRDGVAADNQADDSKCTHMMTTQHMDSREVNNPPLAANGSVANGSQPQQAGPTNSLNESNEQDLTIEEAKRACAMYATSALFVVVVCARALWKQRSAILSFHSRPTSEGSEPGINPEETARTRWAAWVGGFQDMVNGPWI